MLGINTPTPDHECQDESGFAQGANVRTRHAAECYVFETKTMATGPDNEVEATSTPGNDTGTAPINGNEAEAFSLLGNEAGTTSLLSNETRDSSSVPTDGSPIDDFLES
ncbi:hypothetical protein Tco_0170701 [Tanacetum coccineum]